MWSGHSSLLAFGVIDLMRSLFAGLVEVLGPLMRCGPLDYVSHPICILNSRVHAYVRNLSFPLVCTLNPKSPLKLEFKGRLKSMNNSEHKKNKNLKVGQPHTLNSRVSSLRR